MSTSAPTERPPTPPRSNDGETGSLETPAHAQGTEPYKSPRSILPAPNIENAPIVSQDEIATAQLEFRSQDPYGDPSLYQTAAPANTFYPIQPVRDDSWTPIDRNLLNSSHQTFVRTTQLQTPPATNDYGRIHTRSGRVLESPLSPTLRNSSRVTKTPRMKSTPKASRKSKATKTGTHLIDQPLSILTKDYKIPVRDMDAWVHRPVSDRLEQAAKNKDHISRPMNSFMLYRSAYADRAKHFCKENNHQVVSQVTGASWPLEPKEVREMYEEYARIERDAHHNAHPDYKFTPNKNASKKHRFDDDDEDDDKDPEWYGSRGKRSRTWTSGPSRSHSSTPFDDGMQLQYQPAIHPSSYWASNPYGQPPRGMSPESYYQPVVNQYNQQVEEVATRRLQYPAYGPGSLIGLPSNSHPALLGGQYPEQLHADVLDPQLAGEEQQYRYSHYETVNPGCEVPRSHAYGYAISGLQYYEEQPPSFHPGMATLTDGRYVWEEHGQPGAEFDEVFQRWS